MNTQVQWHPDFQKKNQILLRHHDRCDIMVLPSLLAQPRKPYLSLTTTMSLQINLTGRDLLQAYQDVLDAKGIDWALFTYEKGTNDLKLQATGDGGLEELEEEFSDGR